MADDLSILDWPDKYVGEHFAVGAEWGALLTALGASIATVTAEVVNGVLTIDDPAESSATGTTQKVFLKDGEPGLVVVKCTMTTDGGDTFIQMYQLTVKE